MRLFDFSRNDPPVRWGIINDGVMGGLSQSRFEVTGEGTGRFSGTVSLAHGGGFASVKTTPHRYSLAGYDGIRLKVRGDGRRYTFRVRMTEEIDQPAYEAPFETVEGVWREVDLPFRLFRAVFRGREVEEAPPLDIEKIVQFGLMIKERQAGPFCLEVAWIRAWKGEG